MPHNLTGYRSEYQAKIERESRNTAADIVVILGGIICGILALLLA